VASALHSASQSKQPPAQPIRLHPQNPHYFLFRGKAIALITSGEHYGAVLNADVDFKKYLATIDADGLNYTRIFGGSYIEVPAKSFGILRNDLAPQPNRFIAPWVRSGTPGYAGGGNKFNLTKWNPEYFERYRAFLADASKRGIVVEITLFSSHYDEMMWKISPFHPSNNVNNTNDIEWKKLQTLENGNILAFQEKYARKLVDEARDFDNVIFEIQNEPWSDRPTLASVVNPYLRPPGRDQYPNSIDVADALSVDWQASVAKWITDAEASRPNHHLIAQNYSNFLVPVSTLVLGVDIVNFHYAYPDAVTLNYGINKAIAYDETGFLGREDDAYRRQAWNFMLAGGSIFDALDYSFSPGHEDGQDLEPNGPGGGSPTFRHQLKILREFLDNCAILKLRPDTTTVKRAGVVTHVLSNPGLEYAIYLDGNDPTDLALTLPGGDYRAEWFNTKTGAVDKSENLHQVAGEIILKSPPFENGIALRVARTEK
jgi:hypothetical protein